MDAGTFSGFRTAFWAILTPVAWYTGWLESVTFVSLLSLWALVESAYAARRADRNEKLLAQFRQIMREECKQRERPLPPGF